jgi:hypothetical protein
VRAAAVTRPSGARGAGTLRVPAAAATGSYTPLACIGAACSRLPRTAVAPAANATAKPPAAGATTGPASGGPAGNATVSGRVTYASRKCFTDAAFVDRPLGRAVVRFRDANGVVMGQAATDGNGDFRSGALGGPLPWTAKAVTDGPRIQVGPAGGANAYEIALGTIAVRSTNGGQVQQQRLAAIVGDGPAGAANLYVVLDDIAQKAVRISPVAVPKLPVIWRYTPDFASFSDETGVAYYDESTNTINVTGVRSDRTTRYEWEPFALAHEYGHAVLDAMGAIPPGGGGDHGAFGVYPSQPALPFEEGLANGFAAVVTGDPRPTAFCENDFDFDAVPAQAWGRGSQTFRTPPVEPDRAHLAQFNETAVGGAVYKLAGVLGGIDPVGGLGKLYSALKRFKDASGRPADRTKDIPDALALDAASTPDIAAVRAIEDVFLSERMQWSGSFYVTMLGEPAVRSAWYATLIGEGSQPLCDPARSAWGARASQSCHFDSGGFGCCTMDGEWESAARFERLALSDGSQRTTAPVRVVAVGLCGQCDPPYTVTFRFGTWRSPPLTFTHNNQYFAVADIHDDMSCTYLPTGESCDPRFFSPLGTEP